MLARFQIMPMINISASSGSTSSGVSPSTVPHRQAVPFPPRKRRNTGKMCPSTQSSPASAAHSGGSSRRSGNVTTNAFETSSAITIRPGFSPAASIMFVAPALPLPNVRMSKPRRRDSRYEGLKHPAK